MTKPFMKIDTHQHFWHYNSQEYGWIGPQMEQLKRDYLPADLAPLLQSVDIDGTVTVQARQIVEESQWLLELADRHPFIKGVVGWLDLRSARLRDQLEQFSAHPKFCGVRHVIHDEPDDRFMLGRDFIRGIGMLAEFDLSYDILILPKHLPIAYDLVKRLPKQRFVVDHIAKPLIKQGEVYPWNRDIRRLASFENVYCKASGMVTEADWQNWKPAAFVPYLDTVFESFGTKRIMLGSDWPVCTLAADYAEVMEIAANYLQQLSCDEQADIWGGNAKKFYRIR